MSRTLSGLFRVGAFRNLRLIGRERGKGPIGKIFEARKIEENPGRFGKVPKRTFIKRDKKKEGQIQIGNPPG